MAEPLITAGPGKELESGLFPGVDPLSAPFWADGENVEFRNGGIVSSAGYEVLASLPGTVLEMAQAYVEGDQRVYAAVSNGVFMRSSLTGLASLGSFPTIGKPYFETYGSFLLGTNFVDRVMVWRNTGTFEDLEACPFDFARLLHRRDNHIIALNTSNGQTAYEWCSDDDIDDWDPTLANSAGANFIRDLDSEILAVCDMGQVTAVYSKETMGIISFVGQPNVFAHSPAINGVGALGPRTVVQVGTRNFGLNRQGIFMTDGVSFQYVDEPAVHDYLIQNVDFDKGEEIKGYHNEDLSSVIWFFTDLSSVRRGIGYNYSKGHFKKYSFMVEVALERQVFPYPIAAVQGDLVLLGKGHSLNGTAFSKWVRTKPMSAQDSTLWKTWSHLKHVGKWSGATVKFGFMEDPNGAVTWIDPQAVAYENWIDRDSPFCVLEYRADVLDSYFQVSQLQVQGGPAGQVSA